MRKTKHNATTHLTVFEAFAGYGSQSMALRGRDPDNPTSRRSRGKKLVQMLETGPDGLSNTLTSVDKDNLVIEPLNVCEDGTAPTITSSYAKVSHYDITERIKTFEDACEWCTENGHHNIRREYDCIVTDTLILDEPTKDLIAYLKLRIIACALNEGWHIPDSNFHLRSYHQLA